MFLETTICQCCVERVSSVATSQQKWQARIENSCHKKWCLTEKRLEIYIQCIASTSSLFSFSHYIALVLFRKWESYSVIAESCKLIYEIISFLIGMRGLEFDWSAGLIRAHVSCTCADAHFYMVYVPRGSMFILFLVYYSLFIRMLKICCRLPDLVK